MLVARQRSHSQPLPLLRLHLESQCPKAADPYHAGFLTRLAAQQPAQMMKQTAALSTQSLRTQGVFPFFSWKRTGKKVAQQETKGMKVGREHRNNYRIFFKHP